MDNNCVIGVDLGGTKIYTALANKEGKVLAEIKLPTEADGGLEHVIGRIAGSVRTVVKQSGLSGRPDRLGIGAPGPLDPRKGFVYQAPNLGWRNVHLKQLLEKELHIPVIMDNDANLAALGEHIYGAGRGINNMVYVTISTGIGGGLILGGSIYHGTSFSAGEIGHMIIEPEGPVCNCGNRGCLEAIASGTAMTRFARQLVSDGKGSGIFKAAGRQVEKITAQIISQAAADGDGEAREILNKAGKALGLGLANVINLLNPGLVLLGGGVSQAGEILWQPMQQELNERVIRYTPQHVQVIPAALGSRSGLLGAVALAVQA